MLKNKNKSLIFIIILLTLLFLYPLWSNLYYKNKISNCENFIDRSGTDVSFQNCFGLINIDKDKISGYYRIWDDKHNYNVVSILDLDQYLLKDQKIYIYDKLDYGNPQKYFSTILGDGNNSELLYLRSFLKDGNLENFQYRSMEEIPSYFIIDINTGEISLYKTYDEMLEEDKIIFKEIGDNLN